MELELKGRPEEEWSEREKRSLKQLVDQERELREVSLVVVAVGGRRGGARRGQQFPPSMAV